MNQPQRPLSQHFISNRRLAEHLVRSASLFPDDIILEIGPGRGIFTQALLNIVSGVVAVEIDGRLCRALEARFGHHPKLKLIHADFLDQSLPPAPFKVFSSLPYVRTGDIIRKLLEADQPPAECHLVVQREAAAKFVVNDHRNTLAALLYYPWWDVAVTHCFRRTDFSPPPRVDSVLLRISLRESPLLSRQHKSVYEDYLTDRFGRDGRASARSAERALNDFRSFLQRAKPARLTAIRGAFARLRRQQRSLKKIHRTRTDPAWKTSGGR